MIKKYLAKVNTTLYRDSDGYIAPKYELEDVEELAFKRNTIGYIYLIEESEIEEEDRYFEGEPVRAIFEGKNNHKEIWFESLDKAINWEYFDVMNLNGSKALKDFSKITFLDAKRIIK